MKKEKNLFDKKNVKKNLLIGFAIQIAGKQSTHDICFMGGFRCPPLWLFQS